MLPELWTTAEKEKNRVLGQDRKNFEDCLRWSVADFQKFIRNEPNDLNWQLQYIISKSNDNKKAKSKLKVMLREANINSVLRDALSTALDDRRNVDVIQLLYSKLILYDQARDTKTHFIKLADERSLFDIANHFRDSTN